MFVAGHPSWPLVLVGVVGGYLMAGGANAVNMYIDRDIDERMARTRLRPIPSGRMRRRRCSRSACCSRRRRRGCSRIGKCALGGARARGLLLLRIHLHALAQAQHAAEHRDRRRRGRVSAARGLGGGHGRVDLVAVYLFLIIFYWTPPHFWALALIKQGDYGRAGVPMAPLVWGERDTKRQMLWYTVILFALTILPRIRRARRLLPGVARSCSTRSCSAG